MTELKHLSELLRWLFVIFSLSSTVWPYLTSLLHLLGHPNAVFAIKPKFLSQDESSKSYLNQVQSVMHIWLQTVMEIGHFVQHTQYMFLLDPRIELSQEPCQEHAKNYHALFEEHTLIKALKISKTNFLLARHGSWFLVIPWEMVHFKFGYTVSYRFNISAAILKTWLY